MGLASVEANPFCLLWGMLTETLMVSSLGVGNCKAVLLDARFLMNFGQDVGRDAIDDNAWADSA